MGFDMIRLDDQRLAVAFGCPDKVAVLNELRGILKVLSDGWHRRMIPYV